MSAATQSTKIMESQSDKKPDEALPSIEQPKELARYERLCPVCEKFERQIIRYHKATASHVDFRHVQLLQI